MPGGSPCCRALTSLNGSAAKLRRADTAVDTSLIPVQVVHDPLPGTLPMQFILRFWWPDRTYTLVKCDRADRHSVAYL